jgi:hypothetical protein
MYNIYIIKKEKNIILHMKNKEKHDNYQGNNRARVTS